MKGTLKKKKKKKERKFSNFFFHFDHSQKSKTKLVSLARNCSRSSLLHLPSLLSEGACSLSLPAEAPPRAEAGPFLLLILVSIDRALLLECHRSRRRRRRRRPFLFSSRRLWQQHQRQDLCCLATAQQQQQERKTRKEAEEQQQQKPWPLPQPRPPPPPRPTPTPREPSGKEGQTPLSLPSSSGGCDPATPPPGPLTRSFPGGSAGSTSGS